MAQISKKGAKSQPWALSTQVKRRCSGFWVGIFEYSSQAEKKWETKGQWNSEWIYEVIVSSRIPTKNYWDFCPGSLLEGRAKISVIFGWDFGRNDDHKNPFWI